MEEGRIGCTRQRVTMSGDVRVLGALEGEEENEGK